MSVTALQPARSRASFCDGDVFDLAGSFAALNPRAPTFDDIAAIAAVPLKALAKVEKGVTFGPPLRGIGKIIGVGLELSRPRRRNGTAVPKEPTLFLKPTSALCGPTDDLVIPRDGKSVDWEVELGVVIGKPGVYIAEHDALTTCWAIASASIFPNAIFSSIAAGRASKAKVADTFCAARAASRHA